MHVEQVHADQKCARRIDMHVSVIEPRQREGALQVDDAGGWAREAANLSLGPNGHDVFASSRQCFNPGLPRIERVDPASGEHEVGGDRRLRRNDRREAEDQEEGERRGLHARIMNQFLGPDR